MIASRDPAGAVLTCLRASRHVRSQSDRSLRMATVGTHKWPEYERPGVVTGRSGTIGRLHYVAADVLAAQHLDVIR